MTYLLILFVIAIALAPLSHFVPSKRQRQIARMREYAAVHGLFVEFRDVPRRQYQDARQRNPVGHDTIYYGKRLKPSRNRGEGARAWLREEEGFVGLERRLAPPSELAGLPPQVLAAGVDEASCGVYWCEAGTVEDVEQIRQVLEQWAGELRG